MELRILEERANPLLKRTEYRFEVDHATAATPTRDAVRVELSKAVKAPKDRIVIEEMHARYGTARTVGFGAAYQSTEALKAVVREHIQVRNGFKEKAAKGPAAAAEAAPKPAADEKPSTAEAPSKEKAEPKPPEKPAEKAEKPEPKAEKPPKEHAEKSEKGPRKAAEKGAHETPASKKEG